MPDYDAGDLVFSDDGINPSYEDFSQEARPPQPEPKPVSRLAKLRNRR